MPDPLSKFLSVLLNCPEPLTSSSQSEGEEGDDDLQTDTSKSKQRHMDGLFQTMFYVVNNGKKRTPLHVMNSLAIYESSKSSTLIGSFISYNKLIRLQNDMANYTVQACDDSIPLPSHFDPTVFTHVAFDNFDHNEATLSGIGSSHNAVTVLFQNDNSVNYHKPRVSETGVVHGSKAFHAELPCQKLKPFYTASKKPNFPEDYEVNDGALLDDTLFQSSREKDLLWALSRLDISDDLDFSIRPASQVVPSWSGTNSMWTHEMLPVSRKAFGPVLPHPVTKHDTVYTAMTNIQEYLGSLPNCQGNPAPQA